MTIEIVAHEKPVGGKFKDRTGFRFGKLTVVAYAGSRKGHSLWYCQCDCGELCIRMNGSLQKGLTKSCGCIKRKHGHVVGNKKTPEYGVWLGMKERCLNKHLKQYGDYGGRGITIYPQWVNSFSDFYAYVGKRPSDEYSLDRINNDGNYEPGNVRWATWPQQNCNQRTRKNNKLGVKGVHYDERRNKYFVQIRIGGKKVFLGRYDKLSEAEEAWREAKQVQEDVNNGNIISHKPST